ncbi:serine carboxypeptidase, putative [Cordyceps militaris CM01]|uniref:Serine carboxypeptidase, putative n=1 Tax=Cordyceps militaris (strain CM01) TaxID=983644 RepID=G3JLU1_CORMM|nr:serine carboxypeptidase, putative [Cordyceps militaris CM01]EGX90665.1 serine carboxypeptidase, putative [Cordyceps militaris CM01]
MVALHWISNLLVGLSLSTNTAAQFVTAPTSFTNVTGYANVPVRYKQVPNGICELNPNVKSYSGYADIAADQHTFFWFFEAREVDPLAAPLTIWISGGPGSSSMNGLWKEIGPCRVDYFGEVYNNPYAWSRRSNLLFIDQPTQVGFSYSVPVPGMVSAETQAIHVLPNKTCPDNAKGTCGTYSLPYFNMTANSTVNAAPSMWRTLQGFMGAFPQYSRRGVHLVSQSYGGHYAPVFADYFVKQNEKSIPGAAHIDLKSVLIGNGVYHPITQFQFLYNFTVAPGHTYDFSPFNTSTQKLMYDNLYGPGKCLDMLKECDKNGDDKQCNSAERFCVRNIKDFPATHAKRNGYDIRQRIPDAFPYGFYRDYLNRADIQAAIGAFTNFTPSSTTVFDAFQTTGDAARSVGVIEALRNLVKHDINVALWSGDADFNCNWMGNQETARMVKAPGWGEAGYADLATSDGQVNAQVKQSHKFSFTRFFWAGHETPFYQPLASLEYFERVISGRDIATGRVDVASQCAYRSVGTPESTFRQGNSTVQWTVMPRKLTYDTNTHKPGAPWAKKINACNAH